MASAVPAPNADPLSVWRKRLLGVSLPAVADAAAWKALRDDAADLDAVQPGIELDLPVALSLMVEACRSPRIAANLSGLQHVLRMLGSDALKLRMQRWQAGHLDPGKPDHLRALQAMATSRLACLFHARWMRHGRVADAEQRMWITALLGVARWKLPLVDTDLAREIERRVVAGERRQAVERSVLGFDLDALNVLHLEDLGFVDARSMAGRARLSPAQMAAAARRARADDIPEPLPPQLARVLREPLVSCSLAYALALETQVGWHSTRCRRLVGAAATCLNRAADGVLNDLHRAAIEASGETLYTRGLLAPAARLIRIPAGRTVSQPPASRAASPAATASSAPAPPAARRRTQQVRPASGQAVERSGPAAAAFPERCRAQGFSALPEFLRAAAAFLVDAGLPRFALFLRMRQPDRTAVYFTQGFSDASAVRSTSLSSLDGTLLERLIADPRAAYLITPSQVDSVRGKLPEALSGWPPAGGFIIATIQASERPMGFWWADAGEGAAQTDARQFLAVRQMASVFGAEFTRLVRLQRSAAPRRP
ncbi:hypothetical protein [Pseudomarimonas salicorniae]|uniref:HDOD domain-containing protein n=1 Tax=Pseudomarimonas salicorniae TaxID=2933270 RepID=A0ABT0GJ65_9GAMM|nr:hypothetical protein [Lysobacter sp. CAU 1642]MCK7594072.1 hypothetical protein [Lysobacter sp. CAU 1642]